MQVVKLVYGDVHVAIGAEEVIKALNGEQGIAAGTPGPEKISESSNTL